MDELVINQSMTIAILTHSSAGWENSSAGKEIDEHRYGVNDLEKLIVNGRWEGGTGET